MSQRGCTQTNWSWSSCEGIPHYISKLFDEEDIQGVVMVVTLYGRSFSNEQIDHASDDMVGFVGVDLAPQHCLVFDPTGENLVYNTQDLIKQYKEQAQKYFVNADRVELIYIDSKFQKQAFTCGSEPK
jgi:hypothetical protein